ncbi:MAG: hypothetical protein FWF57_00090 [Defluviitaleaceae bacterium]|nr:hypothetical protein [Defluviitaleaceae bacterium]
MLKDKIAQHTNIFRSLKLKSIMYNLIEDIENFYDYELLAKDETLQITLYDKKGFLKELNKISELIVQFNTINTDIVKIREVSINSTHLLSINYVQTSNMNDFISIKPKTVFPKIYFDEECNKWEHNLFQKTYKAKTIIYNTKSIFTSNNKKFYPSYIPNFTCFPKITENLLRLLSNEHIFFKDILEDFKETSYIPKRKLEKCFNFKCKKDLLESYRKYKKISIPKRINRYLLEDAVKLVDVAVLLSESDRARLFQMDIEVFKKHLNFLNTPSEEDFIYNFFFSIWSENGVTVFSEHYSNKTIIQEL